MWSFNICENIRENLFTSCAGVGTHSQLGIRKTRRCYPTPELFLIALTSFGVQAGTMFATSYNVNRQASNEIFYSLTGKILSVQYNCRSSELCKSDVEIVRLLGRHTGFQFLSYNTTSQNCRLYISILYNSLDN